MKMLKEGILIRNYRLIRPLGSGSFASVWEALNVIVDIHVAIKVISKSSINSSDKELRLQREIALLKKVNHPYIIRFFENFSDEDNNYLVMEYAPHGNLLDYTAKNGALSECQTRKYFCQLLSALEYLHDYQRIIHRDLKAENVLLDLNYNLKLIDFGLSNIISPYGDLSTACGSPAYVAPEMLTSKRYTKAADVWSAGVLLYDLIVGKLPFDGPDVKSIFRMVVRMDIRVPDFVSPNQKDLLIKMLCRDPEQRITIDKIKQHPWFSQSEYSFVNPGSLDEETINDHEIIDDLKTKGVDVGNLVSQFIQGEYNENTALYRMMARAKTIIEAGHRANPSREIPQPQAPLAGAKTVGFTLKGDNQKRKVLAVPSNVQVAARRLSRPIAIRSNMTNISSPQNSRPSITKIRNQTPPPNVCQKNLPVSQKTPSREII